MTKLRVVTPEELTQKEIRTLFSLTLRGWSELRYRFHKVVSYLRERDIPGRIKEINATIILAEADDKISGWAMLEWDGSSCFLQMNVRTSCRRFGIGTMLVNEAIDICKKKHHRKPTVEAWDIRSEKFYKKFGNKLEITYYSFY